VPQRDYERRPTPDGGWPRNTTGSTLGFFVDAVRSAVDEAGAAGIATVAAGSSPTAAIAGKSPATVTPAAVASEPREITATNQSVAGLIRRDTGMNAASTRAKPLFAARRPDISGEWFSTFAAIIDSIG